MVKTAPETPKNQMWAITAQRAHPRSNPTWSTSHLGIWVPPKYQPPRFSILPFPQIGKSCVTPRLKSYMEYIWLKNNVTFQSNKEIEGKIFAEIEKDRNSNDFCLDFWAKMFQWSFLKVLAITTGLLTSFGLYPIMLNIIEYNNNRHIK